MLDLRDLKKEQTDTAVSQAICVLFRFFSNALEKLLLVDKKKYSNIF